MIKNFRQTAVGIAIALTAFAGAGKAAVSPFISFTVGSAAGTFSLNNTVASGLYDVNQLSGVLFTSMQVFLDTAAPGNPTYSLTHWNGTTSVAGATLDWNNSTHVLTLNGCVTGLAGISSCASSNNILMTLNYGTGANALGATVAPGGVGTQDTVSLNTATSISSNALLMSDLYLSTPTIHTTDANGIIGNYTSAGGGSTNYTATSESLTVYYTQLATPEPVSMVLFGSGLAAIAFFRRKKLQPADQPKA